MLWNKYPVKSVASDEFLIYHFVSVARKQDTVNIRWLSQYVECSKPVNPLGTGIYTVGFYVQKQQNTKRKQKLAGGSMTDSLTLVRHTSLSIYLIPP